MRFGEVESYGALERGQPFQEIMSCKLRCDVTAGFLQKMATKGKGKLAGGGGPSVMRKGRDDINRDQGFSGRNGYS